MRALVITNSITRRDSRSIEKYLNEVSKYEVLSAEEELRLFKQFKSGDENAFRKIIQANLRFVISVAKQYQHTGLSLDDLINEGNIGLIKAARLYDETRGFKFISYAVWWIRQTILQAIGDKSKKIRLPLNQQSKAQKILKVRNKLYQVLEREPDLDEIAAESGFPVDQVEASLQNVKYCKSLDAPASGEEDSQPLEYFIPNSMTPEPDAEMVEKESLRIEMQHLLSSLNEREAAVLSMYFGIDQKRALSLQDIGEYLGLTRERVRQIRDRALMKLRRKVSRNDLVFSVN